MLAIMPFNRTIVELKSPYYAVAQRASIAFNRTIVELKCETSEIGRKL